MWKPKRPKMPKGFDPWDLVAAASILIFAAGVWLIYMPGAFLFVGAAGLAFSWLAAGGKR
jgi:hypothetical protein